LFLKEIDNGAIVVTGDWTGVILDPCAGGDDKHEMSYPKAIKSYFGEDVKDFYDKELDIRTMDIREDSKADIIADYLQTDLDYSPEVIITNPPFNQALPIIQKALQDVNEGGWVILLLRLNFLETKSRKEFFDNYMPQYIYVHHKRMSFIEGKGTDSVAYAHFCWQKGNYPEFAKVKVI